MEPIRQYAVTLTQVDADHWRMVWDGRDEVVETREFFRSDVTDAMLLQSLRCFMAIEGKPDPTAQSVIDGIRLRGGLQTPAQPVFVGSITQRENGDFQLNFGYTVGDASNGLGFTRDELEQRPTDPRLLAWQIGAFLRFAGHTAFTPDAIAAVESRTFRGW
jgi:hypothetical protein